MPSDGDVTRRHAFRERFASRVLLLLVISLFTHNPALASCPFCYPEGPGPLVPGNGPNVNWTLRDSVSACPAGDSLIYVGQGATQHPSRLRIEVWYNDGNCNPRPKVPPDSIWVTWPVLTGNLIVNDLGTKVFADDSTDQLCGRTWITIPSFSGCGTIQVKLFVSGVAQGTKTVVVRTTDTNANGKVEAGDGSSACDLNYNGIAGDLSDFNAVQVSLNHWHRHALHGTLVRRTSLCGTCTEDSPNTLGDWSCPASVDG